MASASRRNISSKIAQVLEQQFQNNRILSPSTNVTTVDEFSLASKVNFFTKLNRVDKSSKRHGIFTIDLKNLVDDVSQLNKTFSTQLKKSLPDNTSLDQNFKLSVQCDVEHLKEHTLLAIHEQKNLYGFQLDNPLAVYPKTKTNWMLKKPASSPRTVIEFSSPNIAKPLHAGHMRSTFLGNFLANLHERMGENVLRVNYLGDWGTQYGLLAVGFKKYGSKDEFKADPIKHLLDVYVKANRDKSLTSLAHEYISQMEDANEENLKMWHVFKDTSIAELHKIYAKLDVKFDIYESESEVFHEAKLLVKHMLNERVASVVEDGAVQVKLDDSKKSNSFFVQKRDGTTLYITRDLAALIKRKRKYHFDKILYVVDSSQREHFSKMFATIKRLKDSKSLLDKVDFSDFYVPFGRLTNMSTRQGKVVFLDQLIDEATQAGLHSMSLSKKHQEAYSDAEEKNEIARHLGNSHLIMNDLARPRIKDYEFSWANIVSKDESAYSCHYAHARLTTLITRCLHERGWSPEEGLDFISRLNQNSELTLVQHLARYDECVWQSFEESEPYHIVQFLYQLVRLTNLCMKSSHVLNEEDEKTAKARILLFNSARQVIANSFQVLGITPLDKV